MTKTTELRRRYLEYLKRGLDVNPLWQSGAGVELTIFTDSILPFIQSEIEAAERKGFKSGYLEGLHYAGDNICEEDLDKITDSFLKNPER